MAIHKCQDELPPCKPVTDGYDYVDASERWGCHNCAEVEARPRSFFYCRLRATRVVSMGICSQYFPAKEEDLEAIKETSQSWQS